MAKFTDFDRKLMNRAIELAEKGRGCTRPNPMVGAVIVKDGGIIAEGYHHRAGEDHAEIDAIKNSAMPVRNSTMYVSLEPCTITGRTPPCADELIKSGFSKVVIGAVDPNPGVAGAGIKRMEDAGIEVTYGLFEERIKKQNEVFFKNMQGSIPFVCAKIASSIDGKLAAQTADSKWITGIYSRKTVQDLRREYGCVLTGINTILADDPTLFPKEDLDGGLLENIDAFLARDGGDDFTRVILDNHLRIPPDSAISKTAGKIKAIVFTGAGKNKDIPGNEDLVIEYSASGGWQPLDVLKVLYNKYGIVSVMLEAGPTILTSFLNAGLIDKFRIFIAPKIIGGESSYDMFGSTGVKKIKDSIGLKFDSFKRSGEDIMITAYPANKRGDKCLQE